jgi:hypothetical protein
MLCPFCAEEIKDTAAVCKHCHRDLLAIKTLVEENKMLTKRTNELEVELSRIRADLDRDHPAARRQVSVGECPGTAAIPERSTTVHWPTDFGSYVLLPILLLLVAHYLMDIRFNVHLVYLRLVSIGIGLILGYSILSKRDRHVGWALCVGAFVAIVTVLGMSITVWIVRGGGPVLPASAKEWQDFVEYSISIVLATVTGNVLASFVGRTLPLSESAGDGFSMIAYAIIRKVGPNLSGDILVTRLQSIERLLKAGTAIVMAAGTLYTALKGVLH